MIGFVVFVKIKDEWVVDGWVMGCIIHGSVQLKQFSGLSRERK